MFVAIYYREIHLAEVCKYFGRATSRALKIRRLWLKSYSRREWQMLHNYKEKEMKKNRIIWWNFYVVWIFETFTDQSFPFFFWKICFLPRIDLNHNGVSICVALVVRQIIVFIRYFLKKKTKREDIILILIIYHMYEFFIA